MSRYARKRRALHIGEDNPLHQRRTPIFSLSLKARVSLTADMACFVLAASTTPRTSLAPVVQLPRVMMGDCGNQGFNSFRRWPTYKQNAVSLTSKARSFFGLAEMEDGEVTFEEMCERGKDKCDIDYLEKLMNAMPLADQRGEQVMLDVNHGKLEWSKVVA